MVSKMPNSNNDQDIVRFAGWSRRLQALIVDVVVVYTVFVGSAFWVSSTQLSSFSRVSLVVFLVLVLEPVLVAFTGGSIGHHLKGLRIERVESHKNLNLGLAIVRFVIKNLLGLVSLAFMLTTKRHQTLHDMAANSVVVVTDRARAKGQHALPERVVYEQGFAYPSKLRRIFVIILYILVARLVLVISLTIFLSDGCMLHNHCSSAEGGITVASNVLYVTVFLVVASFGWRGRLWGCRRTLLPQ